MKRGPFTKNYWFDFWMYHGGIFLFTVALVLLDPFNSLPMSALLLVIAPITALGNWLADRDFQ